MKNSELAAEYGINMKVREENEEGETVTKEVPTDSYGTIEFSDKSGAKKKYSKVGQT